MKVKKLKPITEEHLSLDFGASDIAGESLNELWVNIDKIIEQSEKLRRARILQIIK